MPHNLIISSLAVRLPLLLVLLFLRSLPQAHALASAAPNRRRSSNWNPRSTPNPDNKLRLGNSIKGQDGVILVDVENVRGKSGFALSHQDVLDKLSQWTRRCQISGQVILIADHGNSQDAYWTANSTDGAAGALAVVFSGNSQKADDVIANDIGKIAQWTNEWTQREDEDKLIPIMVVTDDQGLLSRCRKTTARRALQVVTPLSLLEELEQLQSPVLVTEATLVVQEANKEITLAAEWMLAYSKVRAARHKHIPNKRRKALQQAVTKWQEQLEATGELGKDIFQFAKQTMNANEDEQSGEEETKEESTDESDLHPDLQKSVVAAWEKLRESLLNSTYKKEKTGDRVVLAEQFRKELYDGYENATQALILGGSQEEALPPAQRYIRYWSWTHAKAPTSTQSSNKNNHNSTSTLRMIIISDTHGFEEDLPPLPKGDVLLHLGDFALEGPAKDLALKTFDDWLSKQPHPHKIVLRGNHDPRSLYLDRSGAVFVTSPRTMVMGGFSVALVPFVSRLPAKCLPPQCDMVASHVPPKGVLDKCTSGKLAGCHTLKRRLKQMSNDGKAPKVVLCGHIHESRGWVKYDFSQVPGKGRTSGEASSSEDDNTLVMNVANANPGIATNIENGPVVVELSRQSAEAKVQVEFKMAEDGTEASPLWEMPPVRNGETDNIGLQRANVASLSSSKVLLTIHPGLKTGVSLFNDRGELLHYNRFQFPSIKIMKRQAQVILRDLEDTLQGASISHVALVGGDPELRGAWKQALTVSDAPKELLEIDANEWRKAILTDSDRVSSQAAKTATRCLAQSVVSECSISSKAEELSIEVAESILAGLYVASNLGMLPKDSSTNAVNGEEEEEGCIDSTSTPMLRQQNKVAVTR